MNSNWLRIVLILGILWFAYWGWSWWSASSSVTAFDARYWAETGRLDDIAKASGDPAAEAAVTEARDRNRGMLRELTERRDMARNLWVGGSAVFAIVIVAGFVMARRRA